MGKKKVSVTQNHIDDAVAWSNDPNREGEVAKCCVVGRALEDVLGGQFVACRSKTIQLNRKESITLPSIAQLAVNRYDNKRFDRIKPFEFEIETDD